MCLGHISNNITVNNMKKIGLNGYVYDFSVNYLSIDVDIILNIDKYLINKDNITFGSIKKYFMDY